MSPDSPRQVRRPGEQFRSRLGLAPLRPQQGLEGEGRQDGGPALRQGPPGEGAIAAPQQGGEQRVIRVPGLEHHPPRALGPTGAPGDLDDELGHALRGPVVGPEEPLVQVDQRH